MGTCLLFPKSQEFFSFSLTIHRLAAKSFIQTKDMGYSETPANDKKDVLKVSLECGVISSHTAFIAINKDLNKPVQGPLVRSDVPRPMLCGMRMFSSAGMSAPPYSVAMSAPPILRSCGGGEFYSNQIHTK